MRLRPPAPLAEVARLVEELRVHPVLAATVWARGIRERASEQLLPPLRLAPIPALHAAAERLHQALERRERILLHGDYDADGVSATALLTLGLRSLGGRVTPFLPDRMRDGYGIAAARVPEHAAAAELFVSLDCGINDLAEVAALRAAGVDVVVTDHHTPSAERPDALVVHPLDGDGTRHLTGAGVAFHLLWALHERLGLEPPLPLAELATLGTVADVAPLLGPNRALVRVGLEQLVASERPGVRALVTLSKLRGPITARHVAFVLGPRLNAAGRLGQADAALELLLTPDERRGRVLATLLSGLNEQRRQLQETMLAQAEALVDDAPALVLRHPEWHPGVMGIVASQLLERTHKPVFLVAQGTGSVRSPPGVSAVAALQAASEHLRRWGGHTAAAGFALDEASFEPFREAICAHVATLDVPPPSLTADALLHPAQVDAELHAELEKLEPYGEGHDEPLFALASRLDQVRPLGRDGSHLQASLQGVRAVGWGMGALAGTWRYGDDGVSLASVTANTYQERTTIELRLRGIVPSGSVRLADAARVGADGAAAAAVGADGADAACFGADGAHAVLAPRLRLGPVPPGSDAGTVVRAIEPTDAEPLAPLPAALRAAALGGGTVMLDLGPDGPAALRRLAAAYPRVSDARRAFVLRKRGRPWPWDGALAERLERVMRELDLLDDRGRARAGRRVDPYASPTLRAALLARHALESMATLLEALPQEDAERAIAGLLGQDRAVGPTPSGR